MGGALLPTYARRLGRVGAKPQRGRRGALVKDARLAARPRLRRFAAALADKGDAAAKAAGVGAHQARAADESDTTADERLCLDRVAHLLTGDATRPLDAAAARVDRAARAHAPLALHLPDKGHELLTERIGVLGRELRESTRTWTRVSTASGGGGVSRAGAMRDARTSEGEVAQGACVALPSSARARTQPCEMAMRRRVGSPP